MKIFLVFTGKSAEEYLKEGVKMYVARLKHYIPVEVQELTPPKLSVSLNAGQIRILESEWIVKNLPDSGYLVLLDETGKSLSSAGLADFLQARMNQGIRNLTFIIGGAYGVSDALKQKADFILSLSTLTFTHQMSRLILAEQLYRAMTILKNEPYHNP
jgi:23S rRNA (pseudouridine1915-N3)-methyltransferase